MSASQPANDPRGYNFLAYDGPGQGAMIREDKVPYRPDWENVLGPVDELIQAMQFRNIHKTPLYLLLVVVGKAILLLPANGLCLACDGLIVNGANQPQLLIKL